MSMSNVSSVVCGSAGSISSTNGDGKSKGCGDVSEENIDGDDQDESTSKQKKSNTENELTSFREEWQRELEAKPRQKEISNASIKQEDISVENKAKSLFLKGVENEQSGKLYEAIQFYKKAVQLVPDIEFKLYESTKSRPTDPSLISQSLEEVSDINNDLEDTCSLSSIEEAEDFDSENVDLFLKLQRRLNKTSFVCYPEHEQKATHISELPIEIILYILRWVVSSDLDLRSLELCSEVCRGLYVCARDPKIWQLACVRVWGINCGGLSNYGSWREMFINRPRLHFNGCYISKTTYLRNGENSFQDQFYRPWHIVEYYRYLRFFPEGKVLMLTTPDDPVSSLVNLKSRSPRHSAILVGHYRLRDNIVTIAVHRQDKPQLNKGRSRKQNQNSEQTFHLELKIVTYKFRFSQLVWTGYSILSRNWNGQETSTSLELVPGRFPPFWFSRVKSYTSESENPLM